MGQSINLNYTKHEQTARFNMFDYSGNVKIQTGSNLKLKQLGERCGSCFCPPTYNAGKCAPGLECKHNPQIPDAAGKCVATESRTSRQSEEFDGGKDKSNGGGEYNGEELSSRSWITIGP